MSRIEDISRRPAISLIKGVPSLLSTVDQMAVASLICLISIRLEFIGREQAVSPTERDWLRSNLIPSKSWQIWIARFGGSNQSEYWAQKYALRFDPTPADRILPEYCNAYVTTYVIGRLCAHAVYFPVEGFSGYEGVSISRIWP